jgi:site-specific DNA-cytosine methylase
MAHNLKEGKVLKVAVICEYSGTVRDAFIDQGHEAISFDLLPSDSLKGLHWQGDITTLPMDFWEQFDIAICHPPCTHLAVSGARWFKDKQQEQSEALEFVRYLMALPIPKMAIENPVSIISSHIRKPDQIIQPYEFGHMEQKKTCLWLKGLPKLKETNNVYDEMMKIPVKERERIHYLPPGPDRWKLRSKTYQGIADAMSIQWTR